MAGCSIVFLTMLFMPVFLVVGALALVGMAAYEFVTSVAFPVLVASWMFGLLAFADAARVLWVRFRAGSLKELQAGELKRAAILCAVAFVLFVVTCVLAGGMIMEWVQEVQASNPGR